MTIWVDTTVRIDLIQADPDWLEWSRGQLIRARASDDIAINAVIDAERMPSCDRQADLDEFVRLSKASMQPFSAKAAWDAGIAFATYRAKGGHQNQCDRRFFHRCSSAMRGLDIAHPGRRAIPHLLPWASVDLPVRATSAEPSIQTNA